jgi:hypothetical protein
MSTTDSTRTARARVPQQLPAPSDTRERITALFRERDAVDARACDQGGQKVRGQLWALEVERLESGDDVYEPYGVIAAAGIELPREALALIADLPQDWSRVCRIDNQGRVWTASVKEKTRAVR